MDSFETSIISSKDLAGILGVTTRRIRQLTQNGVFPQVARGKYVLGDAMRSYISHLQEKAREAAVDPKDLQKELTRLRRAQADKTELEVKEYRGELHRAEDVEDVWTEMLSNFRARILAVPTKLAPQILGIEDLKEMQKALKDAVYEALQELSEYDPDRIAERARKKRR
jgi:phage terminase Nu1 subunit (DNA packaging protein)